MPKEFRFRNCEKNATIQSNEKRGPGLVIGYFSGDEILRSYVGILSSTIIMDPKVTNQYNGMP